MNQLEESLIELLKTELSKDYSWKYIPKEIQNEIITSHLEKIAKWLIDKTFCFREG